MRDQKETPIERAVYWIEYVIRHRGAPHLQSEAKNLSRLKRNLFDVLAFLGCVISIIVALSLYVLKRILKALVRKCYSKVNKQAPTEKKKLKGN